jgi:hypothetical protein
MLQIWGSENYFICLICIIRRMRRWLRRYATSRKVAGSRPNEMNEFSSIYLILLAAVGPEVFSASNRNECQKQKIIFLVSKVRPVRRDDNLTAIYEPFV